jgi:hypothetical protein
MSGFFQNIDPHPLPAFGAVGGHTRWVERGWGVNILEDARHSSVLYICKYFVLLGQEKIDGSWTRTASSVTHLLASISISREQNLVLAISSLSTFLDIPPPSLSPYPHKIEEGPLDLPNIHSGESILGSFAEFLAKW